MHGRFRSYKKSETYKYVAQWLNEKNEIIWIGMIFGKSKIFKTEQEAAKYIDIILIKNGRKPINILKPIGSLSNLII